jgi:hypothetical protein
MAKPLRSVIREHLFEDSLSSLIPDPIVADRFVESAEWLLARDPEIGFPIRHDSPVWSLPLPLIEGKQTVLYYTFDETTVHLLAVELLGD